MKQDPKVILSFRAKEALLLIAKFTIDKFGVNQSLTYSKGLKNILRDIATNPELGRSSIPTKGKMVFRYRYQAYLIFYYPVEQGIFIARVLGGEIDYLSHIP